MRGSSRAQSLALLGISVSWVVALFLPALEPQGAAALTGWEVLRTGWRGVTVGVLAWYANPLFVAAVAASVLRRNKAAGILAGLALVLGLTAIATAELVTRAGYPSVALSFRAGFYVWVFALAALALWTGYTACSDRSADTKIGR